MDNRVITLIRNRKPFHGLECSCSGVAKGILSIQPSPHSYLGTFVGIVENKNLSVVG